MATVNCKAKKVESTKYYKLLSSYTTSGSFNLSIPEDGIYYVEMYGGGGGASQRLATDAYAGKTYGHCYSGGSGSCFKGLLELTTGNYAIQVGQKGNRITGGTIDTRSNGGDTIFPNYVTAKGGIGAYITSVATVTGAASGEQGYGGEVEIINSEKVQGLRCAGNDGHKSPSAGTGTIVAPVYPQSWGGFSVYDNTYTGYGAGGGNKASNSAYDAVAGAFLIYKESTSSDFTLKIVIQNIFGFYKSGNYYCAK